MGNALQDGLSLPDLFADTALQTAEIGSGAVMTVNISGGQVTTAKIAALAVTAAEIGAAAVTAAKQNCIGLGSPVLVGNHLQIGSGVTGAGSDVWHLFPTAFAAAPIVTVSQAETKEAIQAPIGSMVAGSFYVQTVGASQTFTFIAVGSGNL